MKNMSKTTLMTLWDKIKFVFSLGETTAGMFCFIIFLFCYLYVLRPVQLIGASYDTELLTISGACFIFLGCVILLLNIKKLHTVPDIYFLVIVSGIDICICYLVSRYLQADFPSKIDPGLYHREAMKATGFSTWVQFAERYDFLWFRRALFSFFIPYKLFGATPDVLKIASTFMHILLGCNIYYICKIVFNSKRAAQLGIVLYYLIPTSYFSINSASHDLWGASYLSFCLLSFIVLSDGRLIDYLANIKSFKEKKQIKSLLLIVCLYFVYILFAFLSSMARGIDLMYIIFAVVLVYLFNIFFSQCKKRNLTRQMTCVLFLGILIFTVLIPYVIIRKSTPDTFPDISLWKYRSFVSSPNRDIIGDGFPYINFPGNPDDGFYKVLYVSTFSHASTLFYSKAMGKSFGLFSLNDIKKTVTDSDVEIINKVYNFQNKVMPVTCTILWSFVLIGMFYLTFSRKKIDYRMSFCYSFSLYLFGTLLVGEGQTNYLQTMYPLIVVLATEGLLLLLRKTGQPASMPKESRRSFAVYHGIPVFFCLFGIVLLSLQFAPACFGYLIKSRDFIDLSTPQLSSNISFSDDMTNFIQKKKNFLWTYIPLPSKKDETFTAEWAIPDYPSATIRGFFDITNMDLDSYNISLTCGNNELIIPPREQWVVEKYVNPPRKNPMYSIFINQSIKNTDSKLVLKITCKDNLKNVNSSFDRMIGVHSFQIISE